MGNSFTQWNSGLQHHVPLLSQSSESSVEASQAVAYGQPLKNLWVPWIQDDIASGDYDIVVLQEDLPETDVEAFFEHARLFAEFVRDNGAEPVLFMHWAYRWITIDEIAAAHAEIAAELGLRVAPVGLAWQRLAQDAPDIDPYDIDREHPSLAGTYLAANVIHATLYGEDPTALSYVPEGMSETDAQLLREVAWEAVQEYEQAG